MSGRDRDGYFALVVMCLVALLTIGFLSFTGAYSKGYQTANQEYATQNAQYDTAVVEYRKCLDAATTLDSARQCADYAEHSTRESHRAEQDLNAQKEMADWAEGMLWAAWILGIATFGATVIGVRYVYLTLIATQDMAKDAKEIGGAQVRAWLSVDTFLTDQRLMDGESALRFTLLANCTPATAVMFFAEIAATLEKDELISARIAKFSKSTLGREEYGEALFPGSAATYNHELMLRFADIDAALDAREHKMLMPIVYGCLNYRVVGSSDVHQTTFGFHVSHVIDGQAFALIPTRPNWLEVPMVLTRPGPVKAS
jgi:hypothetical protein